jgi:hypothetical protein
MSQLPFERLPLAVPAAAVIERGCGVDAGLHQSRKALAKACLTFRTPASSWLSARDVGGCGAQLRQRLHSAAAGRNPDEAAYMAKWWCTEQQGKVTDGMPAVCFFAAGCYVGPPDCGMYADARIQRILRGTTIMKDLITMVYARPTTCIALAGVRIVEFYQLDHVGRMLADMGAVVIVVARPRKSAVAAQLGGEGDNRCGAASRPVLLDQAQKDDLAGSGWHLCRPLMG